MKQKTSSKDQRLRRKREYERKVADYRRFLKDDFDWDYHYILRLLKYKLERTRKCILKNNIVVSSQKIGKQIAKVEDLLGRVMEDSYFDEISEDFHKKYGRLKMVYGKSVKGANSVPVTTRFQKETKRNATVAHREFTRLRKKAWRLKQRDLKQAFSEIEKHIWSWWD